MKFDIAIIGGDKRIACMAPILTEKGYRVACHATVKIPKENICRLSSIKEAVEGAGIIVCGIPFAKGDCLYAEEPMPPITLVELQRCLRKNQKVFGGVIPEDFRRICEEREIGCYDFMTDEALTIFNAVATAEGAILEALLHQDTNIHCSASLVLGYGRCAKVLADKLKGLSARVSVCSRDCQELALASSLGFDVLPLSKLHREIGGFEYIYNTIPARVLPACILESVSPNALIIDIASNGVGVDYDAAREYSLHALSCPGLPGKYAAQSSARRLAEYVCNA